MWLIQNKNHSVNYITTFHFQKFTVCGIVFRDTTLQNPLLNCLFFSENKKRHKTWKPQIKDDSSHLNPIVNRHTLRCFTRTRSTHVRVHSFLQARPIGIALHWETSEVNIWRKCWKCHPHMVRGGMRRGTIEHVWVMDGLWLIDWLIWMETVYGYCGFWGFNWWEIAVGWMN